METLPEELLDRIVSEVIDPLPPLASNKHHEDGIHYRDLLSLLMVSRKFYRITEPYIYRDLICSGHEDDGNETILLKTLDHRIDLYRHIKTVSLEGFKKTAPHFEKILTCLPNLRRLDILLEFCDLRDWTPVLKLPSITTLRIQRVVAEPVENERNDDWDFLNGNITSLDVGFACNNERWEDCNQLWRFAAIFRHLTCLRISGIHIPEAPIALDAPAFRCIVHAFKHAFETTLRDFDFRYNSVYCDNESPADEFDARAILKGSRLEHLKLETDCLRREEPMLRSLEVGPSSLPSTLKTLYIRHAVDIERLNQAARNLMHSDEAQCLSQLVKLATRTSRFPHLQKLTLVIFLPYMFEEVASRVVKIHARQAKVQLDLMFAPEWDYISDDYSRSWPEYDVVRDPRHALYNISFLTPPPNWPSDWIEG